MSDHQASCHPVTSAGSPFISKRTVMDAFNKTSVYTKDAEIGFSTSSRHPLSNPTAGPGPGAYTIRSTLGKVTESNMKSACQFSLRGREKFGDPNERSTSKTCANEPGPGNYNLTDKFLGGTNSPKCGFPKGVLRREGGAFPGPGPGSYKPLESMGRQPLSTQRNEVSVTFSLSARPGMAKEGSSSLGPGEYSHAHAAACEAQIDSTKVNSCTSKFGMGYKKGGYEKKIDLSEPFPGPGSYVIPGGISTAAKGAPYRNSPAASLSGRNKFGSPF